jgi:hypothetical protein
VRAGDRRGRGLVCLVLLGLLSIGLGPVAAARTSCSYVGAPTNSLTVTANDSAFASVRRIGSEIAVWEYVDPPVTCAGGVPTVFNTDLIMLRASRDSFVEVRLAGGPFAPGATAEREGASEIEIEFRGNVTWATVIGTRGADAFRWGPGRAQAGLNLNAATAGDKDVDVTVLDTSASAFLEVDGRAGDDTIIPTAGARIPHFVWAEGGQGDDVLVAPRHAESDLEGGPGADVIRGGSASDFIDGGFGDDVITGGGGADEIWAGRGRDVLSGGRGGDWIFAGDGERDQASCGAGRDRVGVDRRDRLGSCEVILP